MDATPISIDSAASLGSALPALGSGVPAEPATGKWVALHDAAAVVAALAGVPPEPATGELLGFAEAVTQAPRWRRELAVQGVEDLAAIMEPGLAALIAVHTARGGDATAPARALWHEFTAARDALLALVPAGD